MLANERSAPASEGSLAIEERLSRSKKARPMNQVSPSGLSISSTSQVWSAPCNVWGAPFLPCDSGS
jgi:hypothetical protein